MRRTQSFIPLPKRILISFGVCWLIAMLLTVIYGVRVRMVGHASLDSLWYLGIIQVAVIRCVVLALLATPLTIWALRSYDALKWITLLFLILIGWVFVRKSDAWWSPDYFWWVAIEFRRFDCHKILISEMSTSIAA